MLVVDHMHQLGVMHRCASPWQLPIAPALIALSDTLNETVSTPAYASQGDAAA